MKKQLEPNLSFYEFVRWYANEFEEQASREWTNNWFEQLPKMIHDGDCTHNPYTCDLCVLEDMLDSYSEYTFDYENFKK
jgi:hypothetical protein